MFLFGLIFFLAGIASGTVLMVTYVQSGELMLLLMSAVFYLAFCGVGGGLMFGQIKQKLAKKKILTQGTEFPAKIVEHRDGVGATMNGVPPLDIVVKAEIYGEEKIITIATNEYSSAKYPIGATCMIAVLGADCCVVPNSVSII